MTWHHHPAATSHLASLPIASPPVAVPRSFANQKFQIRSRCRANNHLFYQVGVFIRFMYCLTSFFYLFFFLITSFFYVLFNFILIVFFNFVCLLFYETSC